MLHLVQVIAYTRLELVFCASCSAGDGACLVEEWAVSAISCLFTVLETSFFWVCALSRCGSLGEGGVTRCRFLGLLNPDMSLCL